MNACEYDTKFAILTVECVYIEFWNKDTLLIMKLFQCMSTN